MRARTGINYLSFLVLFSVASVADPGRTEKESVLWIKKPIRVPIDRVMDKDQIEELRSKNELEGKSVRVVFMAGKMMKPMEAAFEQAKLKKEGKPLPETILLTFVSHLVPGSQTEFEIRPQGIRENRANQLNEVFKGKSEFDETKWDKWNRTATEWAIKKGVPRGLAEKVSRETWYNEKKISFEAYSFQETKKDQQISRMDLNLLFGGRNSEPGSITGTCPSSS